MVPPGPAGSRAVRGRCSHDQPTDSEPRHPPPRQVQVSYLRRALGLASAGPAPSLRTEAGGYALDVDADAVDVYRFERGVSSAAGRLAQPSRQEVEAGLAELRAALGLWRGERLWSTRLGGRSCRARWGPGF